MTSSSSDGSISLLLKLSQNTDIFGGVSTKDQLLQLMKKEGSSFTAFDLYRDGVLINDCLKFDSGSTIFWQILCSDTVKLATRRQKILKFDYQVVIIKSQTKLPLIQLRESKLHTYYVIFLPISILLPSNFSFKISKKNIDVYTTNSFIQLWRSDIAFNVCTTIPDFMAPYCETTLRNQFITKLISSEHVSTNPKMIASILFKERVLSLIVFKNLEFFQHEDYKIIISYTKQLEALIQRRF